MDLVRTVKRKLANILWECVKDFGLPRGSKTSGKLTKESDIVGQYIIPCYEKALHAREKSDGGKRDCVMRVYHGSYVEVAKPDIIHSRKKVDFGVRFYVTPIEEQVKNWCKQYRLMS